MRVAHYRFETSRSLEQLCERVTSDLEGLELLSTASQTGGVLRLAVTFASETERRPWQLQAKQGWPQLIARCEARAIPDGSQVDIVVQLDRAEYLMGIAIAPIVGFVFYGFISQSISIGLVLACTALIWFHVNIMLDRQNPDDLANIIARQLDLTPLIAAEARVRRGT
ncbi:MAG TPA: hypothetical protein VMM78_12295 [Thermomicrobiales bacterium]|nr:hypothetical protein [Thermomicrobiales bacterium]